MIRLVDAFRLRTRNPIDRITIGNSCPQPEIQAADAIFLSIGKTCPQQDIRTTSCGQQIGSEIVDLARLEGGPGDSFAPSARPKRTCYHNHGGRPDRLQRVRPCHKHSIGNQTAPGTGPGDALSLSPSLPPCKPIESIRPRAARCTGRAGPPVQLRTLDPGTE